MEVFDREPRYALPLASHMANRTGLKAWLEGSIPSWHGRNRLDASASVRGRGNQPERSVHLLMAKGLRPAEVT